jgi:hypothetical protein
MMWSSVELINLLKQYNVSTRPAAGSISLFSIDSSLKIGLGVDHDGSAVLILPAQPETLGFVTRYATFDPLTAVYWQEQQSTLSDISILKCKVDLKDEIVIRSFSAIISGIIDIQNRFGEVGNVLWTLKSLFESGFTPNFSQDELVGLIGELLVLESSSDPTELFQYWHADPKAKFDFSSSKSRIEVKTTTSQSRHHYISSSQFYRNPEIDLYFISIKLEIVQVGWNFRDIYASLLNKLTFDQQRLLTKVVMETLSVPPLSVEGLNFDEKSSISSIEIFDGVDIPFPDLSARVLSATCLISLEGLPHRKNHIDQIPFK